MSNHPLVSVLIPAYNAEKYIDESLKSITNQSYSNLEIIVCEDFSTDKTWEIIEQHAKSDKRIIPIRNSQNLGIAGNRNKLVSLSTGQFIAWQDADDVSHPQRIEKQVNYLLTHLKVVIVGSWIRFFSDSDKSSVRRYPEHDHDIRQKIFRYSPVAQPAAMIRKSALISVGPYDIYYPPAEDLDMSFRLGKIGDFANIQEVLLDYRENISGATYTRLKFIEEKTISIRLKYSGNGYQMKTTDHLYNFGHYLSSLLVPAKYKIKMFNLIRNSRK